MYYNTNDETGGTLNTSRKVADNQSVMILGIFKMFSDENMSPDDVEDYIRQVYKRDYPITSIRRALTNLTDQGLLEKTDKMVMGKYGKKTHTWKLAESEV